MIGHRQIGDLHRRQIGLQFVPGRAPIKAGPHPAFGAEIEQAGALYILPDRSRHFVGRQAGGNFHPRLAIIAGLPGDGLEIIQQEAMANHIGGTGAVGAVFHGGDLGEFRELGRGDVGPVGAAIAGDVHQTIVRPGPDHALLQPRRGERKHGGIGFHPSLIARDGTARWAQRSRIMRGQIRADLFPALTFIAALPDMLRGDIERAGIMRIEQDREGPLEALGNVAGRRAHGVVRPNGDGAALSGAMVVTGEQAAIAAGKIDIGIARIGRDIAALAATHGDTIEAAQHILVAPAARRHADGRIVLLATAGIIRFVGGQAEPVNLRRREILLCPTGAAIHGHIGAAIIGLHHAVVVVSRDPQIMVVAVRHADLLGEGLAAVIGAVEIDVEHIDALLVLRVRHDAGIVEGALAQVPAVVALFPGLAAVVAGIDAAGRLILDDGVHAVGIDRRHAHPDLAEQAVLRQARRAADLGPTDAAIKALEKAAARPAARHAPRLAPGFPQRGINHIGV